jgi:nucleoside-diphosphate-sugar epimerase
VTSTSEVYGTAQYVPIDEKHPRQPQSPYSATKIGADAVAESFYRAFDLPVVIARPFNTYGPRQSARAVIPTIITQALDGALEIKLGSLAPTRDLTYVADTCRAFVALAECDAAVGRDINMGVGSEVSVGDLAQKILELTGSTAHIVTDEARLRPEKSEVERLLSDNSLLRELAGWEPEVDLDAGLSRTVEWFREPTNRAGYKSGIYNV